jgi:hypothetical protein
VFVPRVRKTSTGERVPCYWAASNGPECIVHGPIARVMCMSMSNSTPAPDKLRCRFIHFNSCKGAVQEHNIYSLLQI